MRTFTRIRLTTTLMAVGILGAIGSAKAGERTLGAYLSDECKACHVIGGEGRAAKGAPPIVGMAPGALAMALRAYRAGERKSREMNDLAASLDDKEIDALADYLASIKG